MMMPKSSRRSKLASALLLSLVLIVFATTVGAADLVLDGGVNGWDVNAWRVQVDGVMGGQSSGSLQFVQQNTIMMFTGDIVLQGGGFSSVRRTIQQPSGLPLDLTPYAGIVVQLETTPNVWVGNDGNNYAVSPLGLHLQFHDTSSSYGYASALAMPLAMTGTQVAVFLPLASFDRASRRGFVCQNGCTLDATSINEMDLYVLFQGGAFEVRVRSITAVEQAVSFASPIIDLDSINDIGDTIQSTISSGGSLYDYGYAELCIAIYRSTLNTLMAASYSPGTFSSADAVDTVRGMACEGLLRATSDETKVDKAFTLRYTLDGILEYLGFADPDNGRGDWRPDSSTAASFFASNQCQGVTSFGGPGLITTPATAPTNVPTNSPSKTPTTGPTPATKDTLAPTASPAVSLQEMPTASPVFAFEEPTLAPMPGPTTQAIFTDMPTTIPFANDAAVQKAGTSFSNDDTNAKPIIGVVVAVVAFVALLVGTFVLYSGRQLRAVKGGKGDDDDVGNSNNDDASLAMSSSKCESVEDGGPVTTSNAKENELL